MGVLLQPRLSFLLFLLVSTAAHQLCCYSPKQHIQPLPTMRPSVFTIIPQLVPLAFLILTSISSPTLTNIYLAKDTKNRTYGIFGYCSGDSHCTPVSLHTQLSKVLSSSVLPSSAIDKLDPYLIIAPIAAGLTFISVLFNVLALVFNGSAGFHSRVYWAFAMTVTILAFLTSSFVCIVTFLLFYPHVEWLAWCLIPSAAINLGAVVSLAFSFNSLCTPDKEMQTDDESEYNEKASVLNPPNTKSFNPYLNSDATLLNNVPPITKSNMNVMTRSLNSSASSLYTKEQDKNDSVVVTERINTKNSSSNMSLKVPQISNPYLNQGANDSVGNSNNSNLFPNESSNRNNDNSADDEPDQRLSDTENNSANSSSSNFTSISQRPINPKYYAGSPPNNRLPLSAANQYGSNGPQMKQNTMTPQQYHQQRQYNQYQNQMSSMPMQNKNAYMRKPKPYMVMGHRPPFPNQQPPAQHYHNGFNQMAQQAHNQPHQPYSNYNTQNQQFNQLNPYAPNSSKPRGNGFVPMKYRARNNMANLPASALGNDGPYSGFR